jgi:hypothetical protein
VPVRIDDTGTVMTAVHEVKVTPAGPPPPAARLRRLRRGPETDAVWARPALLGLLAATAALYLWGLGSSGWANAFYSAAV